MGTGPHSGNPLPQPPTSAIAEASTQLCLLLGACLPLGGAAESRGHGGGDATRRRGWPPAKRKGHGCPRTEEGVCVWHGHTLPQPDGATTCFGITATCFVPPPFRGSARGGREGTTAAGARAHGRPGVTRRPPPACPPGATHAGGGKGGDRGGGARGRTEAGGGRARACPRGARASAPRPTLHDRRPPPFRGRIQRHEGGKGGDCGGWRGRAGTRGRTEAGGGHARPLRGWRARVRPGSCSTTPTVRRSGHATWRAQITAVPAETGGLSLVIRSTKHSAT